MKMLSRDHNFTYFWAVSTKRYRFVGSINRASVRLGRARVEMQHGLDAAPDKDEGVKGAICIIRPNTSHLDLLTVIML